MTEDTYQLISVILAVLCVVAIILRRKSKKKTEQKDDVLPDDSSNAPCPHPRSGAFRTSKILPRPNPKIDPRHTRFRLRIVHSPIHRWGVVRR